MLFAGVSPRFAGVPQCVCAAAVSVFFGLRTLTRARRGDPAALALRAMAPPQLAAAVMLAAGGAVAVTGPPPTGIAVLIVSVVGAVSTIAAGSWQSARSTMQRQAASTCRGSCTACTLPCR